jgi:hypothetical protein
VKQCLMACMLALVLASICEAQTVTFQSLVGEMTDLAAMARFPEPAYTCAQFSSYDRRSTDPAIQTQENWFANGDAGQHLRVEQRNGADEHVMMDIDGPGAIVRFWSANPEQAGIVRVYLDGAPEPTLEMPLTEMLGGGDALPWVEPISGTRSMGWNTHLPIPYANHCKVTASTPGFYYQINYRTYAPGTQVETFDPAMLETHADAIAAAAEVLGNPGPTPVDPAWRANSFNIHLADGDSEALELRQGGAIRRIQVQARADDMEKGLRGCLLLMEFDGEPCVAVPLGDFFGTAPGPNAFSSLSSGVLDNGTMYANWVMPYAKGAELRIANYSGIPVSLSGSVHTGPWEWDDRSMHFRANWRSQENIPTRPMIDWTYLDTAGQGVYAGNMLHVVNPVADWWGEGDEKIYVDGETFPSTFGTGTEDYYGYAWCHNQPFIHAYHNQSRCDGPGNYGHTSVNRFHILDKIPFQNHLKFDMEVWHWADTRVSYAVTNWWYAKPGGEAVSAPAPESLQVAYLEPLPPPWTAEGAIEAEDLAYELKGQGKVQVQESLTWNWSNQTQLWFTEGVPGSVLTVTFPVEEKGRYEVKARFTAAPDYGIADVSMNGAEAKSGLDFYAPGVTAQEEVSLGVHSLEQGDNTLALEVTGKNPESTGHMIGLDYLVLHAAE